MNSTSDDATHQPFRDGQLPKLPDAPVFFKKKYRLELIVGQEIADVLARMSRRARQPNPLANGEQEFLADVEGFTGDFYEWLDDAKVFCQEWQNL